MLASFAICFCCLVFVRCYFFWACPMVAFGLLMLVHLSMMVNAYPFS